MLLLYPPVAKPCEPPAGIASLAGVVRRAGVVCRVADLGLEGMVHLLDGAGVPPAGDRWGRRAWKNREANLRALREPGTYGNVSRYRKAVLELNRVVESAGGGGVRVGLANYQDHELTPTRSADLLRMAVEPERSPFFALLRRRLPELLNDQGDGWVGVSLNYLSQALSGFTLIGLVRRLAPATRVIVGGGLMTSWMRSPRWAEPFAGLIDHCVAGPGEAPLLALLGRSDGAVGEGGRSGGLDFDGLMLDDYVAPGFIVPYSCSSGCYWNRCSFCPERAEGNRFVMKSPAEVHAELTGLTQRYRPGLLHLLDNGVPPAVLDSFTAGYPGVPWYGFARIDKRLADADFCRRLKASGCVMLKLGLESGSQRVLDTLDKGIDLDTAAQALANLRRAGIATYVDLLFGTPAETEEDARRTMSFVGDHHRAITFLNLAIFNMPIDSPEAATVETMPFSDDDLALYTDFRHPQGWDRRQVRRFLDREFKRQPPLAAILRRDPPLFTSNHAPLLVMHGRWMERDSREPGGITNRKSGTGR